MIESGTPLVRFLPSDLLPLDRINPPEDLIDFLSRILVTRYDVQTLPTSDRVDIVLSIAQEAILKLPGLEGIALILGGASAETLIIGVEIGVNSWSVSISAGTRLRFSRDLLRPVTSDSGHWVDDPARKHAEIVISAGIEIRDDWSVNIIGANEFQLAPSMISDSGFVIEGTLALDLSETSSLPETLAMGLGNSWRGAVFKMLTFHLPDDLNVPILPTDLTLTNFHIGSSGISGSVRGNWSPTISGNQISGSGTGTLFGIPFGLKKLNLDLLQSAVTGIEIKGILGLPFFDQALDVELSLDLDGNISLAVDSTTGLKEFTLSSNSTEVMRVEVARLTVEQYQGVLTVGIGGSIIPRFGGLDWPTFDVQKLSIDSNGNVHLEGGWLTLRKQKPLNFYGFQMEITKLGFGRTEDGGKWIGFSGGVKLVEGLPAGASVEGLRIVWYDDGSKAPSVTFNGVGVEFQVPGVLTFKGSVAYSGLVELPRPEGVEQIQRFDGDIKLKLVALNMEIDAALVIGSASGPRGNYTFFAFYLGVELPAGIPLFSTGVALYGMAGLFATQMEPNKRENEGWYENPDGDPGWYKRDTPGVTDLKNKWDPRLGSLAFGVGVTLGTVPDNGTSFHGKFLLVIVLPGPIVLLEGRGDLLKKRASPDKPGATIIVEEPIFRALAVLDNRAGTFTIGLDAQYKYNEQGALIDIRGGVEAFFSFSDASAWHIYLGREEPVEQRIHALFFKNLFEANAYFMLDPSSVRTGAWMGIGKTWIFGPLTVKLEAFIDGKAVISRKPPHFYGHLLLHGGVGLSVFGFGATLNVDAECTADVFDPFHVRFDFHVGIDLPWFLPDFDVDFTKEWGPEPIPPLLPLPLQEIAVEHLKVTTKWPLPRDGNQPLLLPNYDSDNDGFLNPSTGASQPTDLKALPVVPLDSRPHITFGRAMNDDALVGVNVQPGNGVWERIGDPSQNRGPVLVRYGLTGLALHKWDPGTGTWKLVARKGKTGTPQDDMLVVPALYGSWAPVPSETGSDGAGVAQTKLWLWSKNPFDYTRHSGRAWDEWFTSQFPNYPCVAPAPDREICCDVAGIDPGRLSPPQWQCPDHPEISISWVAPDGSIHPDEATITLPQGSKGVKITLSQEHVGHVRRCINFAQYPTGPGSNPRIERRVSFEVLIPDPTTGQLVPAPQTRIAIPSGVAVAGLDCGYALEITLPRSCLLVEMTLTSQAGSTQVEAFNADGSSSGAPVPVPLGHLQPLKLRGSAITRVVVHGGGEIFLHELCAEYALLSVTGSDGHGNVYLSSSSDDGTIEVTGTDLTGVQVSGEGTVQLEKVCVVLPPDPTEVIRREEMQKHFVDELARWSQEGDVLEPDTTYRLKIVTRVEAESDQHLNDWNGSKYTRQGNIYRLTPIPEQTEFAYFRTEGPPGLTSLSAPIGTANPPLTNAGKITVTNGSPNVTGTGTDWSDKLAGAVLQVSDEVTGYTIAQVTAPDKLVLRSDYLGSTRSDVAYSISQFDSGLNDLTRYVRQTVPATVPSEGKPPLLPRPVYRAYDVGVEFNENYVELLYRITRRDLGLYLYNSNNKPVRDALGRLIILSNRWGEAEKLTLTEGEERWLTVVNDCTNGKLDEQKIPRARTLFSATEGQVLDADTVYEARLIPLLLHEDFSRDGLPGWTALEQPVSSKWSVQRHDTLTGEKATVAGTVVSLDKTPDLSKVTPLFDVILLEKDTVRTNGYYRIVGVDNGAKTVTVDGQPKLSEGTTGWRIPKVGAVVQSALVGGGTDDGRDPLKPGTILVGGEDNWSDYRVSAFLRSSSNDGAIGLVFRCKGAGTFYRFSMDGRRAYRRLVRVVNNVHTILAEDDGIFRPDRDYLVSIEAAGSSLRLYLDGAPIFAVNDDVIKDGRIGLYCWNNAGICVSDVRVDDFRADTPVVYRFQFTTSQFINFYHHLHSYQDETWVAHAETDVSTLLASAVTPATSLTEAEQRAYQGLAEQLLQTQAYQIPAEMQVTRVEYNNQALGFLVQSPEPIDWKHTDVELSYAKHWAPLPLVPDAVKLTDVAFGQNKPNEEYVSLLLRGNANLRGYRIEQRVLPGPLTDSGNMTPLLIDDFDGADSGVLFHETFGPNALDHYTIVDEQPPGSFPSNWKAANGRIEQHGDYRGGPPAGDPLPTRPGTIALLSSDHYSNVSISVTLRSDSQRDIGLVFRYQDSDNYYRLSLARYDGFLNEPFRRLVKRVGGTTTVLWQDSVRHDTAQLTHLMIETFGDRLVGYIDNTLLFSLRDPDLVQGQVGLYCWGNTGAYFEALRIEAVVSDPILWQPSFTDMSGLEIVDEPGTSGGPSTWSTQTGVLTQSSFIQGEAAAWQQQPGSAHDIGISAEGSTWMIGTNPVPGGYGIYRWKGDGWEQFPGGAVRITVDNSGFPRVVNDVGNIFTWAGSFWQKIGGTAHDIGSSAGGYLWIVGTDPVPGGYSVYAEGGANGWHQVAGCGALRIAVAPDSLAWVVNDARQIFRWDGNAWQQVPGEADDIGIGANGYIWIARNNPTGGAPGIARWNGLAWEAIEGSGTTIAVDPDGIPWRVDDAQHIFRWSANPAHLPGTYVLGGSSSWRDILFSAQLRSDANGAIGVLFRYRDADSYYRFSMDRQGNYRRLIKKSGGLVKVLWEDQGQYTSGQSYRLSIRTSGGWLSGSLDGVPLFTVYDSDHPYGRVGLYCRANPGAHFEHVLVKENARQVGQWTVRDEAQEKGVSLWRMSKGELVQTSPLMAGDVPACPGTAVVGGERSWTDYRLVVKLRSDTKQAIGVMFRYEDDDNYYRLSLDAERGYRRLVKKVKGEVSTLWEDTGSFKVNQPITLTVDAAGRKLTGYINDERVCEVHDDSHARGQVGLYCWGNTAASFEHVEVRRLPLEASALLRDPGNLGPQSIVGDPNWTDIAASMRVISPSGSVVGMLFRYQDAQHYYRFSMHSQQGYRRLEKNSNGTVSSLWEDTYAYQAGHPYEITMVAVGSMLRGYVNGVPMFVVEDSDLARGRIGLYSSANTDAQFSLVRVYPADRTFADWQFADRFSGLVPGGWTFVDEGDQGGPSQWQVSSGELRQTSAISGGSSDPAELDKPGTYALAGDTAWTDYRLTVRLRSDDANGAIGVLFRYRDANNSYRFSMDHQGRRLTRKEKGNVSMLWKDASQYSVGREYVLTIDCFGAQLSGYLDGVPLFSVEDSALSGGRIGLYCRANTGARFKEVQVGEPVWVPYYTFGREAPLSAGTRLRVYSGNIKDAPAVDADMAQRFVASLGAQGYHHWSTDGVDLRLRSPIASEASHMRRFLPGKAYNKFDMQNLRMLRKADGTGYFLGVMATGAAQISPLTAGQYRLTLTYHRENSEAGNKTPEQVMIDIPWETPRE